MKIMRHIPLYNAFNLILFCTLFLLSACAAPVQTPQQLVIALDSLDPQDLAALEDDNVPLYSWSIEEVPLPDEDLSLPVAGEKNSYGIVVTPELETAYRSYLEGDGDTALTALDVAKMTQVNNPLFQWHVLFLKAQVMIMMGRAAEAESLLPRIAELEIAVTGGNLSTVALRGEAKVWLGDFDGAKLDFFSVLKAMGSWDLPVSFPNPPSNIAELYIITSAQIRSFTGLAASYLLQGDYGRALDWAREAEKRFNGVHFIRNHPLYGMFFVTHLDSFYGRASNLVFLAAATLAHRADEQTSMKLFQRAEQFFERINFPGGKVFIESLKASSYIHIGRYDEAESIARDAVRLAVENGMVDFVWRIETVLGKVLFNKGKFLEAEAAFRRAQASLDVVSGTLSSDRAKTRFGVGKEDVTYYLARLDRVGNDHRTLFEDLERGRARAFVDLLADSVIKWKTDRELLQEIRDLDREIVAQRVRNSAPGGKMAGGGDKEQALLEERQQKISTLRMRDPDLSSTMSIWVHSLDEVRQKLAGGEVLVYVLPFRGDDPLSLLIITPQKTTIRELSLTAADLRRLIEQFSTSIGLELQREEGNTRGIRVLSLPESQREQSGREAIAILQSQLDLGLGDTLRSLYVVPGGPFHFMPWGLLDTDYPIIVLPTGGWLNRKPAAIEYRKDTQAVVVGNPEFGGELPQLPGAEVEAYSVAAMLGVRPLVGDLATESNLRRRIGNGVKMLHLATHGVFDHKKPLESAIFLSEDGKAHPLSADALFHDPLPASVVVLSACETGIGRAFAGEDTLGLLRSLYLGGVTTTLSSLWPVDDEGTKEFMNVFYRSAANGDYGRGWLAAVQSLKEQGYSPAVYSAFVLGGLAR